MDPTIWSILIPQIPSIISAIGVFIIGLVGALKLKALAIKSDDIHALVNSQFSEAKAEIKAGNEKIAALERRLAALPDASAEDKIRAELSTEHALAPVKLPRTGG